MPSCASISSKPRFTSSSPILCDTNGATSMSPASASSTSSGTWSRPLTPPNEEPATRRPVIRNRGTTSSTSPLPATPATVHSPHPIRADSTAWRMTATLPVLERVVGAEAVRQLEDLVDDVRPGDECLGRALALRQLEPPRGEVDRDDPVRALQTAARDGAEPDHARAEDDAGRAGLHLRGVHRGAEPGREPTGEAARMLRRPLRADLGKRDLGHHRVLGEGGATHEVPDRLAVSPKTRRAVREEALVLLLADREAEVRPVTEAVDTLPALRREERHDLVARRHRGHARADPLDDARALVPGHRRRVAG